MSVEEQDVGGHLAPAVAQTAGIPTIPNATVERRALLDRLDAAPAERLVLVSAAPGSGKTALLAAWAASQAMPVAWYGCTDVDADRDRFWTRLERALLGALAPHGMVGAEVVDDEALPSAALAPAEALTAQLATAAAPALVVIDDLHLAGAPPAELVALIAGMPPGIRLALATRVDPPFSLARLRLQGSLLELRQEDLRFTAAETAAALEGFDLALAGDELAQLHELTEGWPAGVHLVALALRDRAGEARSAAVAELAAHDRHLGEFLLAEVVDRQPPELRSFLQVTSVFDAFDAELHDAVTGRRDGFAMLEEVRVRNLFLVDLETTPPSYRYHHLVQDFLRRRFALEDPEGVDEIHHRAAAHHIARRDYGAAVPHLLASDDLDAAHDLLAREAQEATSLIEPGGAMIARRWLAARGEERLTGDPSALLECTMALNAGGFHTEAEVWLQRWSEVEPGLDDAQRGVLHGAWGQHHLFGGDPEACLAEAEVARRFMDLAPGVGSWEHALTVLEFQGNLWRGDHVGARAAIAAGLARPGLPLPLALVRLPAFGAAIAVAEGALRAADAAAASSLQMADELGLPPLNYGRGEPDLVRAEVALDQGRAADAERHLERALALAEVRRPQLEVLGLLVAARLAASIGAPDRAADALARARTVFVAPSALVLARIDEVEAQVALELGDRRAAASAIARLPAGFAAEVLSARAAIAAGAPARAATHLAAIGEAPPGLRAALDVGLLRVRVRPAAERLDALDELADLVGRAAEERFVRPFLLGGPELWDLLAEVPLTGHVAVFRDELLDAARQVVPVARVGDQADLVDPLSERELTVLRYLASRLDSSEIAAALYISVNTVRSHVKAIYRKLGVRSRPDAVARARELELL